MKKLFSTTTILLLATFLLQGCLKDTYTRTYTMLIPVYKTTAEVRANIKSSLPRPVEKPGKLVVLGNYIFLNELDKGIHVIDNSNPSSPVNKHFINIPGNIDIAVKGNILYADLYTDLVTLDISNPSAVQISNIIDNVFEHRRYFNFSADTNLVIVDWIKKDTTVTIQNGNAWNARDGAFITFNAGSLANAASPAVGIAGSMARFTLMNNYLYTVTETSINVFNIATPTNPVFKNKVSIGWGIETIYPFGNNLFIGSSTGMFIYNTTNPEAPQQLSRFTHAMACDPVIADGNFAYVTLRTGNACNGFSNQMDVINIQNINTPTLVKTYPLTNPHGLSKNGNLLFICDGQAGLKVYDASDVNNILLLQTISGIDTYDAIALSNNIVLVVAKDGLYQYNYAIPSGLQLLSKININ